MFFKHFASKNQLPGLSINGTLVENELIHLNSLNMVSKTGVERFENDCGSCENFKKI